MKTEKRKKHVRAAEDFAHHLDRALRAFRETDKPLWKRTQNGLIAFKGLDMTHLPPRLDKAVDLRFGALNKILAHYDIKTWDDYQNISDEDLLKMQSLFEGFVQDQ